MQRETLRARVADRAESRTMGSGQLAWPNNQTGSVSRIRSKCAHHAGNLGELAVQLPQPLACGRGTTGMPQGQRPAWSGGSTETRLRSEKQQARETRATRHTGHKQAPTTRAQMATHPRASLRSACARAGAAARERGGGGRPQSAAAATTPAGASLHRQQQSKRLCR